MQAAELIIANLKSLPPEQRDEVLQHFNMATPQPKKVTRAQGEQLRPEHLSEAACRASELKKHETRRNRMRKHEARN